MVWIKSICLIFMIAFSVLAVMPESVPDHSSMHSEHAMPMAMTMTDTAVDGTNHNCCESAEDCVMDSCLTSNHCSTPPPKA